MKSTQMKPIALCWKAGACWGLVLVFMLGWGRTVQAQQVPLYYDYIENGKLAGGRILVDMTDPDQRASFGLDELDGAAVRAQWPVTTLIDNGPPANRINIVILGDGYTASEMNTYASDTDNVLASFFADEPMDAYASFFNVYRVDVTSNESGVDEPDFGIFRDTALDMTFNCSGIPRLLCVNVSKAYAAAASAPAVDQILVLANTTRYGGAGYGAQNLGTLSGGNASAVGIAIHEFGHAFADLADEYDYADGATYSGSEPSTPNVSIFDEATLLASQLKWWRWMDLPNVSTFEGASYNQFGIYRPTFNSAMRSLNRPFEEVNTEQFVRKMYEIVSVIDDVTPPSGTPMSPSTTFFVTPTNPVDHLLDIQWSMDGADLVGQTNTTFTPDLATLAVGLHTVGVTVFDSTARIRDESLRLLMTESRQWPIEVLCMPGECIAPTVLAGEAGFDKDRYVSFGPNTDATSAVATRVTRVGSTTDKYVDCTSLVDLGVDGFYATLIDGPLPAPPDTTYYCDLSGVTTGLHVRGCSVVPGNTYDVAATSDGTLFSATLSIPTTPPPFPDRQYGDTVGSLDAGIWTAPDGLVTTNDIVAAVKKFSLDPEAAILARLDTDGDVPNAVMSSGDILRAVTGFAGQAFGSGVTGCNTGTCIPPQGGGCE